MTYSDTGVLVTTDWLESNLNSPRVRVIDASWYLPDQNRDARKEYEQAHIPGAMFWDIDIVSDQASPYPHTLPHPADFSDEVCSMGIENGDHVIIYDGHGLFSAPRVWWMFRVYGHDRVSVLDGGFPKWRDEGRPIETGPEPKVEPSAPFEVAFRPKLVRALGQMKANVESGGELVLDARSPARFAGKESEPRPGVQPGHIPGSRNLHYASLINPEAGTLRVGQDLARLYAETGVTEGRPVVCSCGSGITAAALALGLHLLGHEDVSVYDGSWAEWGAQEDTPKETGEGS